MALREGHFMPASLLGTQFATLEEPMADEHPIVVSIEQPASQVVDAILARLLRRVDPDQGLPRE
jgi:gluconate kinase